MSYNCSLSAFKEPRGEASTSRRISSWYLAKLAAEKELSFIPQFYACVGEFFADCDINMPSIKRTHWRLTEVKIGEFRACPKSRGFLVATNGILAFTMNEAKQSFLGHMDNFIPDKVEVEVDKNKETAPRKSNKVLHELLEELVD